MTSEVWVQLGPGTTNSIELTMKVRLRVVRKRRGVIIELTSPTTVSSFR